MAIRQKVSFADWVIPPMVLSPLTEERQPVLLWVHTGTSTIEAAGVTYVLGAGEAIWIPPGVEHGMRIDEGAVVFPFLPPVVDLSGSLAEVHVVAFPPGWEEWLIHQWDDNSHTSDVIPGAAALWEIVAGASAPGDGVKALGLPHSGPALNVARTLLRDPGSSRSIESLAAGENLSAKTLQRQFLNETGMALSIWRTRARIAAAADFLAAGREVGWTSQHVGFATPAGFTKAFKRHTGLTPREYSLRRRTRGTSEAAPHAEALTRAVVLSGDRARGAPSIPPRAFWDLVNDFHVLMWVYTGRARLHVGNRHVDLERGDAIWVPAGIPHSIRFAEGSLMMSIARHHGRVHVGVDELIVFSFPPEAESFLLHTMIVEYIPMFRPEHRQGSFSDGLFRAQFLPEHGPHLDELTGALGDIARALRRDPSDARSLAGWAKHLQTTPARLGREFLAQTGKTFPRWRAHLRMDLARTLLRFGDAPGTVSRHLGYASQSDFTKVFTNAHGMPPGEYQRRENRRQDATGQPARG